MSTSRNPLSGPDPTCVLAALALEVAAAAKAPERFNEQRLGGSYVPRELIERIRTYAEENGFNWRALSKRRGLGVRATYNVPAKVQP